MTRGRSRASNASPTAQFPWRHRDGMADSIAGPKRAVNHLCRPSLCTHCSLSLFCYITHSDSLNYFYGYVCIWMFWTLRYLTPRGIDPKTIEPRWQCQERNAVIIALIPNDFGGTCKFESSWYASFITETELALDFTARTQDKFWWQMKRLDFMQL